MEFPAFHSPPAAHAAGSSLSRTLSDTLLQSIGLIVPTLLFCGCARCFAAPNQAKGDDR